MKTKAQILLATYNGEKFLLEQLESILSQTYTDWEILVRDDRSTDGTCEILANFMAEHPDKMTIIEDDEKNLGPCHNFSRLMEQSTADILCFADQDDIWHPDKMERGISCLEKMQREHGANTPLLVHHDVTIMNQQGIQLSSSFDQNNNIGKNNSSLSHMLVQPTVHGLSATVNKALIDRAIPLPKEIEMHDNHMALVAQTFGHIHYIPDQLADYRIHGNNVAGGQNTFYNLSIKDFSLGNLFNGHSVECIRSILSTAQETLEEKCRTASAFLERYSGEMLPEKRRLFEDFSRLAEAGSFERKKLIVKNSFYPSSPKLAAAFLAFG